MVLKFCLEILLIVLFMQLSFDNFILAEELFAKALPSFEACVLVDSNLCRKLFSSLESPTTFNEIVTSVQFSIPNLNLLSRKLDNFTLY